jgi:Mrp family chromosome partitioning ATPase
MTATDQAFIRAYDRELRVGATPVDSIAPQAVRGPFDAPLTNAAPHDAWLERSIPIPSSSTGNVGLGTSVHFVGTDSAANEPAIAPPVALPATSTEPIYPSAIRQRQYWRHDRPAFGGPLPESRSAAAPTSTPMPHFAPADDGYAGHGMQQFSGHVGRDERTFSPTESPREYHFHNDHPSQIARATISAPVAPSPTSDREPLRPETSVAAFRYPAICVRLHEELGTEYDQVAAAIGQLIEEGRSLVGVAGCFPQDGCTTTLLCLARQLMAQGKRVAIVDANFARPELARCLGVHPTTTWQDVLLRGVPVAEALVRSSADGLTLLASTPTHANEDHFAGGLQTSMTAGALRFGYDVTLLDLGAVLEPRRNTVTWQMVQSMRIDSVLLVTDANRETATDLHQAEQRFHQSHCPVLGILENFAE